MVAPAAGRHHVVPHVLPAPAARDDVVDARGDAAAVHAAAAVAGEQRAAGERNGPPVGDPHETLEPDHAGRGDDSCRAVQKGAGFLQGDCLVLQDEDERAAERYDAERLVRRIEDQDVRHGLPPCTPAARGSRRDDLLSSLSLRLVEAPPRARNGSEVFSTTLPSSPGEPGLSLEHGNGVTGMPR